eukprot:6180495-Pleurochrysis_carterae.AAC.1
MHAREHEHAHLHARESLAQPSARLGRYALRSQTRRVKQSEAAANTALQRGNVHEASRAFKEAPFALLYCAPPATTSCVWDVRG